MKYTSLLLGPSPPISFSLTEELARRERAEIVGIDPFKVYVAILAGVQSRQKLQQMYGKLFNFQTL